MADYHSLLSRAVANLPSTSSSAARQAIYDRARKALLTQLRTLRPPLPDSDIAREESALDAAIAQIESGFASADALPAGSAPAPSPASSATAAQGPTAAGRPGVPSPAPPKPAPPSATGQPAASGGTSNAGPALSRPAAPAGVTARPAPVAPGQGAPERPAQARPPIQPSGSPRPAAAAVAAPPFARAGQAASGAKPPLGPAPPRPLPASGSNAAATPAVRAKIESAPGAPPANLASVIPPAGVDVAAASSAPPIVARRGEGALELDSAPEVPSDFERVDPAARPESEGQRPPAPGGAAGRSRAWLWLALAVVAGAVISVAVAAIVMRQKPQDLAITPRPAETNETPPPASAKIAERVPSAPANPGAAPAAAPAAPAETQGAQPAAPAAAPAARAETQGTQSAAPGAAPPAPAAPAEQAQNSSAPPPVAARAAMLIASADDPQKPVVNLGSTVWSTIPPVAGQPATVAVKAEADIPDLKMHATMTLRKNTDPTLQATHTIDLKFSFAPGAPITGFKDVGLPQMRKLDSTASETLTSVKVKISDDYFLIALANSPQDIARNLDLMKTRAWFDFPLLLNDNRIAKIVFQKSPEGEAMLAKAFEAWK